MTHEQRVCKRMRAVSYTHSHALTHIPMYSYTHSHALMCAFPYGHTPVLLVFRFHLVHKLLSTCHEFGRCQLAHAPILHLPSAQHQSLVLRGIQGHQEALPVPNIILTQPM